ncbi:MAG: helix-turn-helix domain-containing protein [Caldithrix sp.]|nr:helix-turn-helix domain-containing protein [Caldithrix sp.]
MSRLLFIHNDVAKDEKSYIIENIENWNIISVHKNRIGFNQLSNLIAKNDIHFLVFSIEVAPDHLINIKKLYEQFPAVSTIYYYPHLKNIEFANLYEAGFGYCIVGDARQINLIRTLSDLWADHWRRIPQALIPTSNIQQMQNYIKLMENSPIKNLNPSKLAESLHMSESHFRYMFKKIFNQSFTSFKNDLFRYYENTLLIEKKLSAKQVAIVLRYKHSSSFSRSFKNRHGQSWQSFKESLN